MSAREEVLRSIRAGLGRGPLPAGVRDELQKSIGSPRPDLTPAKARPVSRVDAFVELATREAVSVDRLADFESVPGRVLRYLQEQALPLRITLAPDQTLDRLPWQQAKGLELSRDPLTADGQAVLTRCFAGVAEGGVTVTVSSPQQPVEFNFLAATHIVILEARQLLGSYDEIWPLLRNASPLPRSVNMLLGPSRSADIEQTLEFGAHGPLRVHVLLVGNDTAHGDDGGTF